VTEPWARGNPSRLEPMEIKGEKKNALRKREVQRGGKKAILSKKKPETKQTRGQGWVHSGEGNRGGPDRGRKNTKRLVDGKDQAFFRKVRPEGREGN